MLKINASDASNLTHKAAQDVIKNAGNSVDFVVIKAAGTTTWAPQVAMVTGGQGGQGADQVWTKTSLKKSNGGVVGGGGGGGINSRVKPFAVGKVILLNYEMAWFFVNPRTCKFVNLA